MHARSVIAIAHARWYEPRLRLHAVALLETIDASAAVYELLLAGEERMALGANVNAQFLLHRTGLEGFTAYAANNRLTIVRMDLLFHLSHLSHRLASPYKPDCRSLKHTASGVVMQKLL